MMVRVKEHIAAREGATFREQPAKRPTNRPTEQRSRRRVYCPR